MGKLWDIVQGHIDSSPYPPSERQVAARIGISPTALSNWRKPKRLPEVENLRALGRLAGVPYSDVLEAALEDTGYKEVGHRGDAAPKTQAGMTPADRAKTAEPDPARAARVGPALAGFMRERGILASQVATDLDRGTEYVEARLAGIVVPREDVVDAVAALARVDAGWLADELWARTADAAPGEAV